MSEDQKLLGNNNSNDNKEIWGGLGHFAYIQVEIRIKGKIIPFSILDSIEKVFSIIKKNIIENKTFELLNETSTVLNIKWESPLMKWNDLIEIYKGNKENVLIINSKVKFYL
jgi:hypothetical protein